MVESNISQAAATAIQDNTTKLTEFVELVSELPELLQHRILHFIVHHSVNSYLDDLSVFIDLIPYISKEHVFRLHIYFCAPTYKQNPLFVTFILDETLYQYKNTLKDTPATRTLLIDSLQNFKTVELVVTRTSRDHILPDPTIVSELLKIKNAHLIFEDEKSHLDSNNGPEHWFADISSLCNVYFDDAYKRLSWFPKLKSLHTFVDIYEDFTLDGNKLAMLDQLASKVPEIAIDFGNSMHKDTFNEKWVELLAKHKNITYQADVYRCCINENFLKIFGQSRDQLDLKYQGVMSTFDSSVLPKLTTLETLTIHSSEEINNCKFENPVTFELFISGLYDLSNCDFSKMTNLKSLSVHVESLDGSSIATIPNSVRVLDFLDVQKIITKEPVCIPEGVAFFITQGHLLHLYDFSKCLKLKELQLNLSHSVELQTDLLPDTLDVLTLVFGSDYDNPGDYFKYKIEDDDNGPGHVWNFGLSDKVQHLNVFVRTAGVIGIPLLVNCKLDLDIRLNLIVFKCSNDTSLRIFKNVTPSDVYDGVIVSDEFEQNVETYLLPNEGSAIQGFPRLTKKKFDAFHSLYYAP